MNTKKLLVPYNPTTVEASSDFLVALLEQEPKLYGLKSKGVFSSGVVIYLGREVTVNDLFARLVDTGRKIDDVDQALQVLQTYIQMLQDFRIGNVLTLQNDASIGFKLSKLADMPPRPRSERKLP